MCLLTVIVVCVVFERRQWNCLTDKVACTVVQTVHEVCASVVVTGIVLHPYSLLKHPVSHICWCCCLNMVTCDQNPPPKTVVCVSQLSHQDPSPSVHLHPLMEQPIEHNYIPLMQMLLYHYKLIICSSGVHDDSVYQPVSFSIYLGIKDWAQACVQ